MVILHVAPISENKSSGLLYAIPPLISHQNKIHNIKVALLLSSRETIILPELYDFPIFKFNKEIKYDLSGLKEPYNKPDLVIFHSTYIPIHYRIAMELRKKGIPYIITPHGGMTKGAQSKKVLKKKIGNIMFFNNFVSGALALHCLTNGEADETKYWNKKMFIVGNGVDVPESFQKTYHEKNIMVSFIGRLDIYHKGLDLLLAGINKVSEDIRSSNFHFDIYGPDYYGSKNVLMKKLHDYKIEDIVTIHEPIFDAQKDLVLRNTDVFIHTSRFEGQPMSILEAMAYSIPCMVTPGTNMAEEILEANAGWVVGCSEEEVANGIIKMIRERDLIRLKGLNARNLVKNKHSWNIIASLTVRNYFELVNS